MKNADAIRANILGRLDRAASDLLETKAELLAHDRAILAIRSEEPQSSSTMTVSNVDELVERLSDTVGSDTSRTVRITISVRLEKPTNQEVTV